MLNLGFISLASLTPFCCVFTQTKKECKNGEINELASHAASQNDSIIENANQTPIPKVSHLSDDEVLDKLLGEGNSFSPFISFYMTVLVVVLVIFITIYTRSSFY